MTLLKISGIIFDSMFAPLEGDLGKCLADLRSQRQELPKVLDRELKKYRAENPELSEDEIEKDRTEFLEKYYKLIDEKIEILNESQGRIRLTQKYYFSQ